MSKSARSAMALIGSALFLSALACQSMFPGATAVPGSFRDEVDQGNVRFAGNGNLSYGSCQDPTAAVTLNVGVQTKEHEGNTFSVFVNPVSVNALTDGAIPAAGDCEKLSTDVKHDWPAKGLYYPAEGKILFYTCSINDGRAEGTAYLYGEGTDLYFEGEYSCYGADETKVYGIAFSVFASGQ